MLRNEQWVLIKFYNSIFQVLYFFFTNIVNTANNNKGKKNF